MAFKGRSIGGAPARRGEPDDDRHGGDPATQEVCVVLNPAAGGGRAGRLRPAIERALAHRGVSYALVSTEKAGDGESIARAAAAGGCGRVLAVGGDGTVHEVANGLRGSATALAVVPVGSGNDYARMLELRAGRLGDALAAALGPRVERLDLGCVTVDGTAGDEVFVNNCGFAFEAEVVRCLRARSAAGGFARYAAAGMRALRVFRPQPLSVRVAGTTLSVLPLIVQVGNGRFSGGGFQFTPRASPLDGALDVCVVERLSLIRTAVSAPLAFGGRHLSLKEVSYHRGPLVEVRAEGRVAFHLDGELRTPEPAPATVRLSVLPGALRVAVGAGVVL